MSVTTDITMDRQAQLQELDLFIENSKKNLTSILTRLGWSLESITKDVQNYIVCPFDKSHRVPERSLDKHLDECQWKAEGYGKQDLPLSFPSLPPGASSSIKFDEQLQDQVIQSAKEKNPAMSIGASGRLIPRTSDRLVADFTREERCAMYEYVIANTVEPDIGDDIADINKPKSSSIGQKSSYLELLAQERNLKRRRAKYRGVHTNKKSQIEILREVVNQQMEMLAEYVSEKCKEVSEKPRIDEFRSDPLPEKNCSIGNGRFSKKSESSNSRHRSSDDRRDSYVKKESPDDLKKYSKDEARNGRRDRQESGDRRPHKSSHNNKYKHKSKDRHRSKSREKKKRRSSTDRRENRHENREKRNVDRRSEWPRDHRRSRKRSRS
ncbi:U11/U12 small nuclear ribonucleoprotein 48 kDa protein-like [Venturia canescens]|uniref:U11/U12 small nuclear ribonucleoprotein 48 kDa protein-like n=1 Tax=Venturia canescens TaxID=32260 RepID=UPI001C9CC872|nr:U11/U12 small nuclear ribonucleoprotein 48 kDa protein-like [Venturia canescens]XP_043269656.1 U11/U12 small nuclear ribonucleoprotein 48 kDa protein-like [Venturia canescens]